MNPLSGWGEDPLWGRIYTRLVESPSVGGLAWRVGLGSDLSLLDRRVAELGDLPPGIRLLDVPCGGGVALRGVRPGQGLDYVACDLDPRMLERTRAVAAGRGLTDQVSEVAADVTALPFDDHDFEVVASFTGLHCFPDPRAAVTEMVRVLRPDGWLLGSTVLASSRLRHVPVHLAGRLTGLLGPGVGAQELVAWLAEEGLVEVSLERSGAVGYFRGRRR